MRREWCAAAMVTCAAMVGASTQARGQEIPPDFDISYPDVGERGSIGMASDGAFVVAWQIPRGFYPAVLISARRFDAAAQPQGPSFQVNALTTFPQSKPAVAVAPNGEFTVVWSGAGPGGWQVRGRRFDAGGAPVGPEFAANTFTNSSQTDPTVAVDAAGSTVVVWTRGFTFGSPAGSGARVFARRFDSSGAPLGGEFRVNTYTSGHQIVPSVAFQDDGGFVVAWHGTAQDGSAEGVFAQRYAPSGTRLGGEFPVNTYTTGIQAFTCVGRAGNGGFVIGWSPKTAPTTREPVYSRASTTRLAVPGARSSA